MNKQAINPRVETVVDGLYEINKKHLSICER